jgi:hypothetical protein
MVNGKCRLKWAFFVCALVAIMSVTANARRDFLIIDWSIWFLDATKHSSSTASAMFQPSQLQSRCIQPP